jgi:hypothetical protein
VSVILIIIFFTISTTCEEFINKYEYNSMGVNFRIYRAIEKKNEKAVINALELATRKKINSNVIRCHY